MRQLLNLDTDPAGCPVVAVWSEPAGECTFADSQYVLQVIERCIEHTRRPSQERTR